MPVEGPVEPGSYSTAINVPNPHWHPVVIRKKAILLFDGSHPAEAVERPVPPVHREKTRHEGARSRLGAGDRLSGYPRAPPGSRTRSAWSQGANVYQGL